MALNTVVKNVLSRAISLHPFYITRPHLWTPHLWEIDARIALSLERKYCYVRVPKAANTAVTSTLFYHQNARLPNRRREAKRAFKRPSALARFVPSSLESFFCFTFVRNPYDRVLSAYLSKLVAAEGKSPYREIGRRIRERHGHGELTFRAFCAYLTAEGLYGNPHWYPQCEFVDGIGAQRLDFVGRVENIGQDIAHVVRTVFGRADDKTYRQGTATGASAKLAHYHDETTRAAIRELYREDFERFDYDPAALA